MASIPKSLQETLDIIDNAPKEKMMEILDKRDKDKIMGSLKQQIDEVRANNKVAIRIVDGIVEYFRPNDNSWKAFFPLAEMIGWLYSNGHTGHKLTRLYITINNQSTFQSVTTNGISRLVDHYYESYQKYRDDDVKAIMSLLFDTRKNDGTRIFDKYCEDAQKCLKEENSHLLLEMSKKMYYLLASHLSYRRDEKDTLLRAFFLCLVLLHEIDACSNLMEAIKSSKDEELKKGYEDISMRKRVEALYVLNIADKFQISSFCDKYNRKD
jgi:hypothetical protein